MDKTNNNGRAQFTTRLGVIATTVGSAVGLGNIWRFSYEAGTNGGAAFLICYLGFILLIGIPVLCAEFIMGRSTNSNIFGAFRKLGNGGKWHLVGYIGIIASLMILSFYSVVAGWTLEYFFQSITNGFDFDTQEEFHQQFNSFSTNGWRPILWVVVFLLFNYAIVSRGVKRGIERMSNIMMPLLFVIIIVFCVNSLMLPKANEGIKFLFHPDFSKITPNIVINALGQAFFSLSLGLGTMMTYASYFSKNTPLVKSAAMTAGLDTLVAILSGVIIFPAVFTFGLSPAEGPTLVFEVLPTIFYKLPGGAIWSSLFFFLLFIASLSSTISMSEVSIAFFTEETKMSRKWATILNTLIALVFGILCAMSFGWLKDLTFFNLFKIDFFSFFDFVSSNIFLPLGGMVISFFVGWKMDSKLLHGELTNNNTIKMPLLRIIIFCLKYVAPLCIACIFIFGLGFRIPF